MPALRLLTAAALLPLAGCLGPAEFRGWPEPQFTFLDCTAAPNGIEDCFEKAPLFCPAGYQIAELRSDRDINRTQMIIQCGPPPAPREQEQTRPAQRRQTTPTAPK